MAAVTTIYITHDSEAAQSIIDELHKDSSQPKEGAIALSNFISAAAGGSRNAKLEIQVDSSSTFASGTLTCATVVEDDTCEINGVTFTAKDSPSGANQFDVKASDSAQATEIAAVINAHTSLAGIVTASASGAVVTITAAQRGKVGNAVTLTGTADTLEASAARLSGGAGQVSTTATYRLGV